MNSRRLGKTHPFWLLLIGLAIASCDNRAASQSNQSGVVVPTIQNGSTIPIANLQTASPNSPGVAVKGKVGDQVPILEGTVYQLQDATGKIWVLTKQPAPNSGEEVVVKGTVRYKPISINGKEQGSIYLEQE